MPTRMMIMPRRLYVIMIRLYYRGQKKDAQRERGPVGGTQSQYSPSLRLCKLSNMSEQEVGALRDALP